MNELIRDYEERAALRRRADMITFLICLIPMLLALAPIFVLLFRLSR